MPPEDNLKAFVHCDALAFEVFRATENFPKREWYGGLASQLRAFSAAVNIIEGRARRGPAAFRPFLDISWSSLQEVGYALRFSLKCGFLTTEQYASLQSLWDETSKTLWGLLESVSASAEEEAHQSRRKSSKRLSV